MLQRHAQPKEEEQRVRHVQMLQEAHDPVSEGGHSPRCPRCGSPMRKRYRRSDNAPFYGCSRYPDCKGIVNIES
jgi:DNA topoisomerase-3